MKFLKGISSHSWIHVSEFRILNFTLKIVKFLTIHILESRDVNSRMWITKFINLKIRNFYILSGKFIYLNFHKSGFRKVDWQKINKNLAQTAQARASEKRIKLKRLTKEKTSFVSLLIGRVFYLILFVGGQFYAAFVKTFLLYTAFPKTFSWYNGGYVFRKKFFWFLKMFMRSAIPVPKVFKNLKYENNPRTKSF